MIKKFKKIVDSNYKKIFFYNYFLTHYKNNIYNICNIKNLNYFVKHTGCLKKY